MKLLFKPSNVGPSDPRVSHTDFREFFAGINANTSWVTLLPTIKQVTRQILTPRMGKELYDDLATKYNDGTALDAAQTELLEICKNVIAQWTMVLLPSELLISVSDMGVVEKGSSQVPVTPVAQWRYKEYKFQRTLSADFALDELIAFLDLQVHGVVEYFDLYKTSEAYTINKTSFFSSAKEFDGFVKIGSSRRLFDSLAPFITRAEEDVDSIICESQFNQLVSLIREEEDLEIDEESAFTDTLKLLLYKIRRYVASKSISLGHGDLFLTLDTHGLHLSSYTDGFDTFNHHSSTFKGAESVSQYVRRKSADADIFFKDLVIFIHDNIEDLPLIKDSACYESYTTGGKLPIDSGYGAVWF